MAVLSEIVAGARFGKLVVTAGPIRRPYVRKSGKVTNKNYARVRCDCGSQEKEVEITGLGSLVIGCGCVRLERALAALTSHGMSETPTYVAWCALKQRILYKAGEAYENYGGRGLEIDPSFTGQGGFENFLTEVGAKPSQAHSIDRVDNSKGYVKGNLRWATASEQARNKRNSLYVSCRGVKTALATACETQQIAYQKVYDRLYVLGWTVRAALESADFAEWAIQPEEMR